MRGRAWSRSVGLVALVLSAGVAAGLAPVGAATAQQPDVGLELAEQSTWVHDGEEFSIRFRVSAPPPDAIVRLTVYERLRSREAFDATLNGELGDEGARRADQPLAELVPDAFGTVEVRYPVGDDGAGLDPQTEYGVHPVRLSISDAGGETLADVVTYLVLLPSRDQDFVPLSVAVVMEVGAPPGLQPDGSIRYDDEPGAIQRRLSILDQARQVQLTVAPTPETLDALTELGPPEDGLVEGLRGTIAGRQVVGRPYVPFDVDALAAADLLGQVGPAVTWGRRAIQAHLDVEPTPGIWLAGSTLGEAEAANLPSLGFSRAVVPASAVAEVADGDDPAVQERPVPLGEGGPLALVSDDRLAQRLLGTQGRLDAQRFLAELALIWSLEPARARGVVVRVPDQAPVDAAVVSRALNGLLDGQAVTPVTLDQMFEALTPTDEEEDSATAVELAQDQPSSDLESLQAPMEDAYRVVAGLAGMLDDMVLIQHLDRSLLVAAGAQTPDDQRRAYVDRVMLTEQGFADAINTPAEFRITLTAREGTIPLNIDNTSQQELGVRVHLTSSQLEFPDGESFDVVVPPGGARVDVDVRTRASGAFPLGIRVTSPDDQVVLDRTTFTVRSTAISGVGLVLSVGAGLFLLVWWARHWRTARRSSRLVTTHPAGRALHKDGALTSRGG